MPDTAAVIPYHPRVIWRDVIHPALSRVRFATLVCHRRFGKTVGSLNHMIRLAADSLRPAPQYAYFAPYRTQAKLIAWEYLKHYTSAIPGVKTSEVSLSATLPTKHAGRSGAVIMIGGADKPDAFRGTYFDGVILDEIGQMRRNFYGEIVRPAIADRRGWAWRIGTPKGRNALYDFYEADRSDPDRFACLYTVDDTGVIDQGELEEMKKDMTPMEIRQELYCDFTASETDVLITIDLVSGAKSRRYSAGDVMNSARVIGVDTARYGEDRSVIIRRQGLAAFRPRVFRGLNNMEVADAVVWEINDFRPHCVFIDAGRGEGVIDRVRQLGYSVVEANFGEKAMDSARYSNRRAEIWDKTRRWLESGGSLPDDEELCEELSMPTYSFDASNRMVLEKKEKMKERIGKSPDLADALAVTFFSPVYGDVESSCSYSDSYDSSGYDDELVWN
ncbi:MAG: terminase family protein [Synergistaceae bacterium]|jgi:hypothetical protein|nr:terminase family protein [Synergistaceae bacterium]